MVFLVFVIVVAVAPFAALSAIGLLMWGVLLIGVVMGMIGGWWLVFQAFAEDVVCGLLMFLIPFYSLYYIVSRWPETRRPFLLNTAGVGLMFFAMMMQCGLVGTMLGLATQQKLASQQGGNPTLPWAPRTHPSQSPPATPPPALPRASQPRRMPSPPSTPPRVSPTPPHVAPTPTRPAPRTGAVLYLQVLSYSGQGDPLTAARRALQDIAWVDKGLIRMENRDRVLVIGLRSKGATAGGARTPRPR